MSKPLVIAGNLVDAKNVAAHKCVRLSIDVPAELGAEIVKTFGWPTMAEPVSVAVARLNGALDNVEPIDEPRPRRQWSQLPLVQQAAMRCNEPAFQRFMFESGLAADLGEQGTIAGVRSHCGVPSRSHITLSSKAGRLWQDLEISYQNWLAGRDAA